MGYANCMRSTSKYIYHGSLFTTCNMDVIVIQMKNTYNFLCMFFHKGNGPHLSMQCCVVKSQSFCFCVIVFMYTLVSLCMYCELDPFSCSLNGGWGAVGKRMCFGQVYQAWNDFRMN